MNGGVCHDDEAKCALPGCGAVLRIEVARSGVVYADGTADPRGGTVSAVCTIDWAAFGLDSGLEAPCGLPAAAEVSTACVHEHIARSLACQDHVDYLCFLCPPAEWWCGSCSADHAQCIAPLQIRRLADIPAGGPQE